MPAIHLTASFSSPRLRWFLYPAFEAIHSAASGLLSVDAIPQETMRDFEKECIASVGKLQPVEITAYSRRHLSK